MDAPRCTSPSIRRPVVAAVALVVVPVAADLAVEEVQYLVLRVAAKAVARRLPVEVQRAGAQDLAVSAAAVDVLPQAAGPQSRVWR
jgi:hypothetical protein